mmetsp:Transcript_51414/g.111912  ORF Transcript_51414/g.111912 Transcript_51414/m.111912 type:complete len:264 (+) Transcript_51414:277-1068(+)
MGAGGAVLAVLAAAAAAALATGGILRGGPVAAMPCGGGFAFGCAGTAASSGAILRRAGIFWMGIGLATTVSASSAREIGVGGDFIGALFSRYPAKPGGNGPSGRLSSSPPGGSLPSFAALLRSASGASVPSRGVGPERPIRQPRRRCASGSPSAFASGFASGVSSAPAASWDAANSNGWPSVSSFRGPLLLADLSPSLFDEGVPPSAVSPSLDASLPDFTPSAEVSAVPLEGRSPSPRYQLYRDPWGDSVDSLTATPERLCKT